MKKIEIYEQAMCCSTGLCGPSFDPELLSLSFVINNLKNAGLVAERFNLTSDPHRFVENEEVKALLTSGGMDVLPATFVDGKLICKGHYPTNAQFVEWSGLSEEELVKKPKVRLSLKGDA